MSEESKIRSDVVAALKSVQAFPVENTAHVGCPDVCCLLGWIEIKLVTRPARDETRVSVVVRPAQRLWMRNWWNQRGNCWWLTRLRGDGMRDMWMLHEGAAGADHLGRDWTTMQMRAKAIWGYTEYEQTPYERLLPALISACTDRRAAL